MELDELLKLSTWRSISESPGPNEEDGINGDNEASSDPLHSLDPTTREYFMVCQEDNHERLEQLLGLVDLKSQDNLGKTALSYALENGSLKCANILIAKVPDIVNIPDKCGATILHRVGEGSCYQSASVLLASDEIKFNVKYKNTADKTRRYWVIELIIDIIAKLWFLTISTPYPWEHRSNFESEFALPVILQDMPFLADNVLRRLDKSIRRRKNDGKPHSFEINFESIVPSFGEISQGSNSGQDKSATSLKTQDLEIGKEMELLFDISRMSRTEAKKKILTHPVITAFMELKWRRICLFFKIYTLIYTLMAVLFTYYVITVYVIYCPYHIRQNDPRTGLRVVERDNTEGTNSQSQIFSWFRIYNYQRTKAQNKICIPETSNWTIFITSIVLLFITLLSILDELYKLVKNITLYIRTYRNYFQWFSIICIVSIAWPLSPAGLRLHDWQYGFAGYGMFNSWAVLLIQTGRFPFLGLFVEMFVKVLKNFGSFIIAYSFLLLAFATAFCVVFPGYPAFSSIPRALLKVISMMIGEVDYEELFYTRGSENVIKNTWSAGNELYHPVTAHILYGAFIIVVSIVLMNLLSALAVDQIQELRKEAEFNRIIRQIGEISNLENIFFSETLSWVFNTWLGKCLSRRLTVYCENESYVREFLSNNKDSEVELPEEVMAKALEISKNNSRRGSENT